MQIKEIIDKLKQMASKKNVEGMARFGINPKNTLGVSMPKLRNLAKEIKRFFASLRMTEGAKQGDRALHKIAQELWESKIHEARILAGLIDLPEMVSEKQADEWIKGFDSWDVCDQVCMNLFDKTAFAFLAAKKWAKREEEFERRAGFALMAGLAAHNKTAKDLDFIAFLPIIKKYSVDERNFVKKAVNWALRQIGKRNLVLNKRALKTAREIEKTDNKAAKWIAKDAIRELESQTIRSRLTK